MLGSFMQRRVVQVVYYIFAASPCVLTISSFAGSHIIEIMLYIFYLHQPFNVIHAN